MASGVSIIAFLSRVFFRPGVLAREQNVEKLMEIRRRVRNILCDIPTYPYFGGAGASIRRVYVERWYTVRKQRYAITETGARNTAWGFTWEGGI